MADPSSESCTKVGGGRGHVLVRVGEERGHATQQKVFPKFLKGGAEGGELWTSRIAKV